MLVRREHSEHELLKKLQAKGFEHGEIAGILTEFKEKNWQSDERFSESFGRSRLNKGCGPVRIMMELKERGVDTSIENVFDEQPDWQQILVNLNKKKYGNQPPKDMKERAKRIRFFQYKGFTHEMIKQLFNEMS